MSTCFVEGSGSLNVPGIVWDPGEFHRVFDSFVQEQGRFMIIEKTVSSLLVDPTHFKHALNHLEQHYAVIEPDQILTTHSDLYSPEFQHQIRDDCKILD